MYDKLKPVDFSLSVSLNQPTPKSKRSLQNLDFFPILSHDQKLSETTEVTLAVNVENMLCWIYSVIQWFLFLQIDFQKECGSDNKCSSNLQLSAMFVDEDDKPYPR